MIPEHNLLVVSGSVPGPNGGYVLVRQAVVSASLAGQAAKSGQEEVTSKT